MCLSKSIHLKEMMEHADDCVGSLPHVTCFIKCTVCTTKNSIRPSRPSVLQNWDVVKKSSNLPKIQRHEVHCGSAVATTKKNHEAKIAQGFKPTG